MFFGVIIRDYFIWHYGRAWWEMWGIWRNFLWFVAHFFSLAQLAQSWFAPFKRIVEKRTKRFDFEDIAGFVIIGLLSRLIGAIIRTIIITLGVVCLLLTVAGGLFVYLLWAVAPLMIVGLLGVSLSLFLI